MGKSQSSLRRRRSFEHNHTESIQQMHSNITGGNVDTVVTESLLTPVILMEIFSRVNSPKTLITSCALVCRRWNEVLSTPYFWKLFQKRQFGYDVQLSTAENIHFNLRNFGIFENFGRNLIKNDSGEDGLDDWEITSNGGDRFAVEAPPINCEIDEEIPMAFATSYGTDIKHCIVDLQVFGDHYLDAVRPPIKVSEYYTCRADCASVYFLKVRLLTKDELFNYSWSSFNADTLTNGGLKDVTNETSIFRIRHMKQWGDASWRRVEHTFTEYPRGIRYVVFEHGGVDKQFWAGHYGSKMAKANVTVRLI